MKFFCLTLVVVGVTLSCGRAADRPNVIVILVDDLGYGDIGAFGQKIIPVGKMSLKKRVKP